MRGDWLHCNSLDHNPELGQVVVNSVQGEFYVIDHDGTFVPGDPAKSIELAAGPKGDFLYRFGDPARYEQGDPPDINESWTKGTSGHKQIGGSHDVQWIDSGLPGAGHFLVFNNGQYLFEQTAQSYIYEIDGFLKADGTRSDSYVNPPDAGYVRQYYHPDMHKAARDLSKQIVWLYGSKSNQGFFSHIGGGCQRLPNGNTLICSDTEGHLFEVTKEGELVWEYINPITRDFGVLKLIGDMIPMANSVFRCYRYAPDHPALKGKDLSPKGLLSDVVKRPARRDPTDEKFPQPGDVMPGPGTKPAGRRQPGADSQPGKKPQRKGGGGSDRFMRMDLNNDGKITWEEFCAREKEKKGDRFDEQKTRSRFARIDTDRDDAISKEEMDKTPKGKGGRK